MTGKMTDDMSDDPTTEGTVQHGTPEWWAAIVDHVAAHEADVPDPWADVALRSAALTADQESFLAGFDDQPPPPHVGDVDPLDVGGAR
ncbi:hypothetical protein [Desertimonas flava]|jgi:hypothetical protein|uniref:hypothetical protein n=1 Tax=Desertimonas flava TaxID=2064846 RepID=UPI000E34B29E|nr:hypothetical protein [Desertimonas flava]